MRSSQAFWQSAQLKTRNKRTRKMRATPLGDLTKPLLKQALGKAPPAILALRRSWPEIAPEDFKKVTRPVKIRFPNRISNRDGTLDLEVLPEAAFIVQHDTPKLINAINLYFGYQAVIKVNIKQVAFASIQDLGLPGHDLNRPLRHIEPVEGIESPRLAQALANMQALIEARSSRTGSSRKR